MILVFYGLLFVLGSLIGSFLNVVADRIPAGESFLWGHSQCDKCKKNLAGKDLIPVLSYILLGGRCRYCRHRLSVYYPISEIVSGLVFVLTGFVVFTISSGLLFSDFRYLILLVYYLFTVSSLLVIFFTDLKYGIIPFKVVFFAFVISFLWNVFLLALYVTNNQLPLFHFANSFFPLNYIFSGVSAFLFFLLLFMGTKGRGLGFGDVVFVALMGFILGFPNIIVGIYISFLTGAFVSLILVLLGRKRFSGGTIPFGPFLVFGTLISIFWGNWLVTLAMKYLFHV
jgi:leader peptidase (prepilin peptidase)/N-methyltransferase